MLSLLTCQVNKGYLGAKYALKPKEAHVCYTTCVSTSELRLHLPLTPMLPGPNKDLRLAVKNRPRLPLDVKLSGKLSFLVLLLDYLKFQLIEFCCDKCSLYVLCSVLNVFWDGVSIFVALN